jgi:hypothetical protein
VTGLTGRQGISFGCDRCDPARFSACVLANSASTYFLVTPLGKDLSLSGAMAGEKVDPKVDATPIDIKDEDIPEETRKQFEAVFQKEQGDAKNRLLACFGKTRQSMFKKVEFKMSTFTPPPSPSTMATSASTPRKVSFTFDSIKQFANAFLSRFEQSQKFMQDILINLTMQNKGKKTVNDYSIFSPNPSLSATPLENY